MTKFRFFLSLVGVTILLSACVPTTSPAATRQSPPSLTVQSNLETSISSTSAAPAASPYPAVTSRGPELHATDPTSVSLTGDGLQLVEFFRFT